MNFLNCFQSSPSILMEGALGERLKREYGIVFDEQVAMASLVYDKYAREALAKLWKEYMGIAKRHHLPFLATTPTRRANKERVQRSKFGENIILDNVRFLNGVRQTDSINMYIGGLMGCKGDAYMGTDALTIDEASNFHVWQADLFAKAGVDFLFAGIMPTLPEAIGMAKAMEQTRLPYIISFMIRSNGKLIDGTTIHDAIAQIDRSVAKSPICYMTNCVHPKVLYEALSCSYNQTELVKTRFCGIQSNTSPLSPEELDGSCDLKTSGCAELAEDVMKLRQLIQLKIIGGCCGTDNTHMEELAKGLQG